MQFVQASDLDVDIGSIPYEQLETERTVPRGSCEMQRCETLLVYLVDIGSTFDQLVHHHILPIVAGHVQRCISICIWLIDLQSAVRMLKQNETKSVYLYPGYHIVLLQAHRHYIEF